MLVLIHGAVGAEQNDLVFVVPYLVVDGAVVRACVPHIDHVIGEAGHFECGLVLIGATACCWLDVCHDIEIVISWICTDDVDQSCRARTNTAYVI